MKNQDGGLKVPLFDFKPSECHVDAKISLVPTHQLIVPSTLLAPATEIRIHKATKTERYKATKIHTLKPLTYSSKSEIKN